jgi:hypothetical protein
LLENNLELPLFHSEERKGGLFTNSFLYKNFICSLWL